MKQKKDLSELELNLEISMSLMSLDVDAKKNF
jgi:hypothetical protein